MLAIPTGRYCCYPGRWTHLPPSPAGLLSVSVSPDSDAAAAAAATADAAAALGASAASPPPLLERSSSLCSAVEVSRFPLRRFSLLPPPPLLRLLPAFSRPDLPEEKRSRLCVFPCLSRACLGKTFFYMQMAQKDRFYSPISLVPGAHGMHWVLPGPNVPTGQGEQMAAAGHGGVQSGSKLKPSGHSPAAGGGGGGGGGLEAPPSSHSSTAYAPPPFSFMT